jgi:DNA-binding response OmpR family regulator
VRVLIIENDFSLGIFLNELLKGWGHEVMHCTCGNDALQHIIKRPYDLVLMEVILPDVKGEDLIIKLKAVSPDSRIVTITGKNSRKLEAQIRKSGILYYMVKPIVAEDLGSLLDYISEKETTGGKDIIS